MKKKTLITTAATLAIIPTSLLATAPNAISTYEQLATVLTSGKSVRSIVQLDKCTRLTPVQQGANKKIAPLGPMTGGLNFENFNQYNAVIDGSGKKQPVIATSTNMLVNHHRYGPVYNYVRLRVFTNNTAELFSQILDPQSYVSQSDMTFKCNLAEGLKLYEKS